MQLFNHKENKLNTLKEKPFKLEKEMQKLFEANLEAITGLNLVKSEFIIKAHYKNFLQYLVSTINTIKFARYSD